MSWFSQWPVSDLPFEDCEIKSLHKDLKRVFHSSKYNLRAKIVPNYIRISDIDELDYGHLNINSLKNYLSFFWTSQKRSVETRITSETKLGENFLIGGYHAIFRNLGHDSTVHFYRHFFVDINLQKNVSLIVLTILIRVTLRTVWSYTQK